MVPLAFFATGAYQAVPRGFFAVEDGAARAAHGHTMLDLFRADGTLRHGLRVIEPGLFQAELASGPALQVGDEHGIFGAFPFEIGCGDQAALKFLEAATGVGQLRFRRRLARGDENSVKTSLARIAVDFTRDVFGDFTRGDAVIHSALVAHVDHACASAYGRDGVRLAGLR